MDLSCTSDGILYYIIANNNYHENANIKEWAQNYK
jgi:hypothetical protein